MERFASKAFQPGPIRSRRMVRHAGCKGHVIGLPFPTIFGGDVPFVSFAVEPGNIGTERGCDAEMLGIGFKIVHNFGSRHIARQAICKRQAGKVRAGLVGMEGESIIMPAPRAADGFAAFQYG